MVMGDLKELFIAKELTFEQYRAQLAAAHDRSLAEEASDLIAAGGAACGLHPGFEVSVEVVSEKKVVPGVGVSATKEKSKRVQERDHGVVMQVDAGAKVGPVKEPFHVKEAPVEKLAKDDKVVWL